MPPWQKSPAPINRGLEILTKEKLESAATASEFRALRETERRRRKETEREPERERGEGGGKRGQPEREREREREREESPGDIGKIYILHETGTINF